MFLFSAWFASVFFLWGPERPCTNNMSRGPDIDLFREIKTLKLWMCKRICGGTPHALVTIQICLWSLARKLQCFQKQSRVPVARKFWTFQPLQKWMYLHYPDKLTYYPEIISEIIFSHLLSKNRPILQGDNWRLLTMVSTTWYVCYVEGYANYICSCYCGS